MRGSTAILAGILALAATMAGVTMQPAAAKTGLPGLKSYNFTMSPQKLRRYCDRIWLGRFWWKKQRYGCDDIPGGEGRQAKTHEYDIDCHKRQCIVRVIYKLRSGGNGRDPASGGRGQGQQP